MRPERTAARARCGADDSTLALPAIHALGAPAPRVIGRWQILRSIGQGSRACVYLASELGSHRRAALKLLAAHASADEREARRFDRELGALRRLHSPCVIAYLDHGCCDGQPYLVLEYAPGGDLSAVIERHPHGLREADAVCVALACARGLAAVHEAGLVHRDVKPANIFIGRRGQAKLGDLGLVRQSHPDEQITETGRVLGTPAYMAPEQACAADIDIRVDIYALGATLFHLLTGHRPFEGGSLSDLVRRVADEPARDARCWRHDLSAGCADLIARCLAKDREQRPRDPRQLVAELRALLDGTQRSSGAE